MAKTVLQEEHLAPEPPTKGWIAWVAGRLGVPFWGQMLILALFAVFMFIGRALWIGQDRLSKIEAAIRVLASQRPQEQRELIRDLLSQAQRDAESGSTLQAALTTQVAASHISSAIREKTPAPDGYFVEVSKAIDSLKTTKPSPELERAAFRARVSLAEYRSAIQPQPDLTGPKKVIDMSVRAAIGTGMNVKLLLGAYILPVYVHGDVFVSSAPPKLDSNVVIDGPAVFVGMVPDASQTLDGIHWRNGITFVNMRIHYNGGEVELSNVRFVNCTFEFIPSPRAVQMAEFVTLRLGSIKIS